MNGKTWARGAALTVAFTVICTNMVGCAPTAKAPDAIVAGWGTLDVDDQFTICTAWHTQPAVVEATVVKQQADLGATAANIHGFLASVCK